VCITSSDLIEKKRHGERIAVLTCYDFPTAKWEEAAGVDVLLVGDSVGTNILGYASEREVTLADMGHHLKAVVRGSQRALVVVDMPYMTYETLADALDTATHLVGLGASAVKMEGFRPEIVKRLSGTGIDVWAHLGYNPQLHDAASLQAKTADAAVELVKNAIALEQAGAKALVLEMVPEEVARAASKRLSIPTIGIGAGRFTDGQVLVVPDLLGVSPSEFRHSARYDDFNARALSAIGRYVSEVRAGEFPREENVRHLRAEEMEAFELRVESGESREGNPSPRPSPAGEKGASPPAMLNQAD
jgi:3-methyl-2-oxobutanoate hydroxymethyltransferase